MEASRSLYDDDFVRWSEEQAAAIRVAAASGSNLPLDWENLAEEIESLGKSQRTELARRTRTVVEHLLKLECSPAVEPREGWRDTVRRSRADIADLLEGSPSLVRARPEVLARVQERAAHDAAAALADAGEPSAGVHAKLKGGGYTVDQVYGRWFSEPIR